MRISGAETINLGRIGKIKVGEKTDKGHPRGLGYFRFDTDTEDWHRTAIELYGDKPVSLPIRFYTDNDDVACSEYFELRDNAGKMLAIGDGINYKVATEKGLVPVDPNDVDKLVKPLKSQHTTDNFVPKWNRKVTMRFILDGFPVLGFWELTTGGEETSGKNLVGTFDLVKKYGNVAMVLFTLKVVKHVSNTSGSNRSYPVISLYCDKFGIKEQLLESGSVPQIEG